MDVRWIRDWVGLRKSTTRIPFRYGKVCLVHCPQLVLRLTCEIDGRESTGYAGDCLPPGWFDKTPGKSYSRQLDEMIATIESARNRYRRHFDDTSDFFAAWHSLQQAIPTWCDELDVVPLLASFGLSLWERAILDAACRAHRASFAEALRANLFGLVAGEVHAALGDLNPADWLPATPLQRVAVRHTVGMGDPLLVRDIPSDERLSDGRPQALEEYIDTCGVRYFKIKLGGAIEADLERLRQVASVIETHRGTDYGVTIDGNEQFATVDALGTLVDAIRSETALTNLWTNTIAIEQPIARAAALECSLKPLDELLGKIPVIIDESDGTLDAYERAIGNGYGGVSSKNCKGALKAVLNRGLIEWRRRVDPGSPQLMTGEDLCSVGVIPVQADLCLAASLGLSHVERNGHHFHPGLSYLPVESQTEAFEAHPDFYCRIGETVSPRLKDGEFSIASLHCIGFGFDWRPHEEDWYSPGEVSWNELTGDDEV